MSTVVEHLITAPGPTDQPVTLTAAEFAGIRKGVGYSRAELCALLGVTVQTIENWEKGRTRVGRGVAQEMEELEGEWIDAIERLVTHYTDGGDGLLIIPRPTPRGQAVTGGRPDDWWVSIAHQVSLRVPGLCVRYAGE